MSAGVLADLPARPSPVSRRGAIVLGLLACGLVAYLCLDVSLADLVPRKGGFGILRRFLAGAFAPALDYEEPVAGAGPFLARALLATWRTLLYAAAAMGVALVAAFPLGFLASSAWWARDPVGGSRRRRLLGAGLQWSTRLGIAGLRSVHELLWAVVLLCALGLTTASAIVAIALPYAGTLAKVFSEMIDEASPRSGEALRAAGARPTAVFLVGQLPRALPDMLAYAFYRFECAVRSAAVLGFFGFPTLGYYLRTSFDNLHYRETWTYLYVFFLVVLVFEAWSIGLRRRFVA